MFVLSWYTAFVATAHSSSFATEQLSPIHGGTSNKDRWSIQALCMQQYNKLLMERKGITSEDGLVNTQLIA